MAFMPMAWGTSAEVHGPVELAVARDGASLCAHVRSGSPNEARQGWSVALWAGPAASTRSPVWQQDTDASPTATQTWPDAATRCAKIPTPMLRASQPYTVEISSIRLYRSQFCWQSPAGTQPARLLAVDESTQRCASRGWIGQDGHALTTRGWWDSLRAWWHDRFGS